MVGAANRSVKTPFICDFKALSFEIKMFIAFKIDSVLLLFSQRRYADINVLSCQFNTGPYFLLSLPSPLYIITNDKNKDRPITIISIIFILDNAPLFIFGTSYWLCLLHSDASRSLLIFLGIRPNIERIRRFELRQ